MGSSSRRKAKRKKKVSNEDIATYRERDKLNQQRKRKGMLNVSQVDDVPIDNDNAEIENLENENLENEMLLGHNVNCMIDMLKMKMHRNLTYLLIIIDMKVLEYQNG